MNKTNTLLLSVAIATMSGCSAIPAFPGASQITISHQPAGEDCEFLDEVMGSQGNFVTADFTSDRNLIEGARNDMRNNALNLGANYIVLETENHSHNTSEIGVGGTFSSVVIGNAYYCPNLKIYKTQTSQLADQGQE